MRFVLALSAVILLVTTGHSQAPPNPARALVTQYCGTCHSERVKTAGIVLDANTFAQVGNRAELWEKALHQLRAGTMPPPNMPRPDQATYARVIAYLTQQLAAVKPNPGDLPPVHRLSRTEYKNSIRDLLALDNLPKEMDYITLLPADNQSSGFDNLADTLFVSPVTMERYLDAARKISRLAVGDPAMGMLVNIHLTPIRQPQDARNEALPFGTRGGTALEGYFPLEGEYEFRVATAGLGRDTHQIEVTIDGERKAVTGINSGTARQEDEDSPNLLRFRFPVSAGPRSVGVAFVERSQALAESPLRPPGRSRGALPSVVSVTITGPYDAKGPGDTPSRRRIFVCRPADAAAEPACVQKILSTLARRAFRRDVTAADTAAATKFYQAGRAEAKISENAFELGIQRALERMLVSPQFLFRIEKETGAPGTTYRISDFELASRLSFFLWSAPPDDALLDVASSGKLRNPGVLEQQVNRMIADPRSASLVTNFAAQWLYLRDVEGKDPDLYLFRDFDEGLRASFVRETELFVDSVLRGNRPVTELLTANYSFLNERLAKHYQIPNIAGSHFRRVTLPADSHRGGLLGQGSVLLLTSYATRTSAVLRGKYVLENLLNSAPPPPPPNIPSLVTEGSKPGETLSMREAMQKHRANPACASCHARMDPIGFALENYDGVGRWRDRQGNKPIDVVSTLPDGSKVDGVAGVKQLVLRDPAQFVEALTSKLLMYALGRNVQYYDGPVIRNIAKEAAAKNNTFGALVAGVVRSVPFDMRVARAQLATKPDR